MVLILIPPCRPLDPDEIEEIEQQQTAAAAASGMSRQGSDGGGGPRGSSSCGGGGATVAQPPRRPPPQELIQLSVHVGVKVTLCLSSHSISTSCYVTYLLFCRACHFHLPLTHGPLPPELVSASHPPPHSPCSSPLMRVSLTHGSST